MQKTEATVPKATGAGRQNANASKASESRAMQPQDKTGAYGEKRKAGSYLE